ncbi:hypothetical protein L1987_38003 [Smallanthus sonchifolius]|uniref:Uncharacterized protein n=1 Tax=Smallanthus sonchifolius TaxID=185202 RepID=A0ACB9HIN2_9ASTR|nr:hypothetical protein L1987_38003 [Smallanthus sonchifolius]
MWLPLADVVAGSPMRLKENVRPRKKLSSESVENFCLEYKVSPNATKLSSDATGFSKNKKTQNQSHNWTRIAENEFKYKTQLRKENDEENEDEIT